MAVKKILCPLPRLPFFVYWDAPIFIAYLSILQAWTIQQLNNVNLLLSMVGYTMFDYKHVKSPLISKV
jgi:hypothetical protein